MWFGTSSSVECFDGHRFKHYPVPENSDRSQDVNAIIGMPQGEIWFGNNAGLWRIGNDDQVHRVAADSISEAVYALVRRDSCLYVGSQTGLYILQGTQIQRVLLGTDALSASNIIKGLAVDDERLWMATHHGLYAMRWSDKTLEAYRPRDEKMNIRYSSIYLYKGQLYLALQDWGVVPFHLNSHTFGKVITIGPVSGFSASPKEDLLYVSTNGRGIYAISAPDHHIVHQLVHHPESHEGIRSNSVYSILVDNEGILWAGLFQIGIDYSLYQHSLFSVYALDELPTLPHEAIRCMASGDGTRVIGTRDGLFFIDDSRRLYRRYVGELRSQMVMSTCFYQGQYYIGTFGGGMYCLNPVSGVLTDFDPTENALVHGQVFSIMPDSDGCLWVGTNEGLYGYRDGRQLFHYTDRNSQLPRSDVYRIYFDSSHRGWICTGLGMALLDTSEPHTIHTRFPKHFVNHKLIRDIYETSDHSLYFCPDKGDLFVSDFSLSHFRSLSIPELQGRSLLFAMEDDEQWLWIGTNDGLFRYDRQSTMESYSFVDGLQTTNFLNCMPYQDTDGTLWFGSSKGLYSTDIQRVKTKRNYPYPLRFTEVAFEDDEQCLSLPYATGMIKVPSTHGKLTLRFSDFTYTDPKEVSFEYRLKKKDQWHTLTGAAELTLYNLSGHQCLQLRHCGRPDSVVTLDIVAPLFTPGQWAWMVSVPVAIGCALLLFYRRRKETTAGSLPAVPATDPEDNRESDPEAPVVKYKQVNLTEEDCRALARSLENLMAREKPYLDPKLKLTGLGQMLGAPTYKLSYLFSQHLNQTFYDYVNEYRIREFKALVAAGRHKSYTISTLIEQCGFTSRTSFFRNFKALTGMTPNEYINRNEPTE